MKTMREERFKRNIIRVSSRVLEQLRDKTDLDKEMMYFYNILKDTFVDFESNENRYIGSYCVMVPDEIIYAYGYIPVRLCAGNSVAAMIGDEIAPRDACPVLKASYGFSQMSVLPIYNQCEAVVLPMTCDGKRKSAEILSEHVSVIPLSVPMGKSDEDFEQMLKNMKSLTKTLSMVTKRKLSNKSLVKAYKDIYEAQKQAFRLSELFSQKNPSITGSQFMAVMNSFCYAKPLEWAKKVDELCNALSPVPTKTTDKRRKKARVLIAGSPITFPNYKIPLLLEEMGAQIVGDETCMSGRMLYDPVIPDDYSTESMLRAFTARYVSACSCPVFDQLDDQIYRLTEKIKNSKAEGIVYYVLRGCTPYDFELSKAEEAAEKMGIPLIRVETDFSLEDQEQVKIRLEAFVEMLEQRR